MREVRAEAPGRVNLIGEHTDYHDGFVLPCVVPQRTHATLRPNGSARHVTATSAEVPEPIAFDLGAEVASQSWGDYVQGLTWVLRQQGFQLSGFDLQLRSEVPLGSGLSSSAALEVAVLRAIRAAFQLDMDDVLLARLAQRAEVEFVGAPVGIMDQMASSVAQEGHALFLDTRSLETEQIPLPSTLDLVVINSGVTHQHAIGDYALRRRESEEAARLLGVDKLRDASVDVLEHLGLLPEPLGRRARHVITENARVLEARAALRRSDLKRVGQLFAASHASMRDDYEVSVPAVDLLVDIASSHPDVFGARMTGGGFGGAVVIAARAASAEAVATHVSSEYHRRSRLTATVLVPVE